jgi:hypothetical protein
MLGSADFCMSRESYPAEADSSVGFNCDGYKTISMAGS